MKYQVYAVLDAKVGNFGMPFFDMSDEAAIRNFTDAVNDGSNPNNLWFRHPEDFALYNIGEYDTAKAVLTGSLLQCLVTASALKNNKVVSVDGKEELYKFHDLDKKIIH